MATNARPSEGRVNALPPGPPAFSHGAVSGAAALLRQKRKQVARACDECRKYRIRCDNGNPCANCRKRDRACSNGNETPSTLASAEERIRALQAEVETLQRELRYTRNQAAQHPPTPAESSDAPWPTHAIIRDSEMKPKRLFSYGVSLSAPRSANESFLGPSSLYYFATRMVKPLSTVHQESAYVESLLPQYCGSGESGAEPATVPPVGQSSHQLADIKTEEEWSPMQEQYFTDRYWQSVHTTIIPILDEAEFKTHHQSLWSSTDGPREPSALVDIVIALCMQLGLPAVPGTEHSQNFQGTDVTMAGQRYYRRAQALLAFEMENPTLSTLQCYLLCAIYVCAGSFHNMVDITLALAVRSAYILGLHLDPPASLSRKERERRRILWWATYTLETKISAKLGRPFGIDDSYVMPETPSDDKEAALLAGSMFAPIGPNETWLSFNKHQIGLYRIIREAHNIFFGTCAAVAGDQNIWRDNSILEACAESLRMPSQRLDQWRDAVPSCLRMRRRGGGATLSTDGSAVEVEAFSPLWLQRQCLLLELTYHNLSTNMFRPLISFSAAARPGGFAEALANRCALHAISYTRILHQILTTVQMLESWNETFHWQWNSVLTLIGFVLASPCGAASELVTEARNAIDLAKTSCDIYAAKFSVATKASQSIQELMQKVDMILSQRKKGIQRIEQADEIETMDLGTSPRGNEDYMRLEPPLTGMNYAGTRNDDLFDMVMGVDFWDDMGLWLPNASGQMPELGPEVIEA